MFASLSPHPFIIAEIGVNHNGDLETAKALIRAAKDAGADAVKVQSFRTDLCLTPSTPLAAYQAMRMIHASQYDMLKELELSASDHHVLKALANEVGLMFLSTPDDDWSLDLLRDLNVEAVKVASAECANPPFLRQVGSMRRPVILSTGMSTLAEVRFAVDVLLEAGAPDLALLHCTSSYPCPPDQANMAAITTLRSNFSHVVGYSDHTIGMEGGVMAVALGCRILEKHLTLDRTQPGPDHQASQTPAEFAVYVAAARTAARMMGSGEKTVQDCEQSMRLFMRRKIVAARALTAGAVLKEEDLAFKRASAGVEPTQASFFIGCKLKRSVEENCPIVPEDLANG